MNQAIQQWFNNTKVATPKYEYVVEPMNLFPAFTARDGDKITVYNNELWMLGGWDTNQAGNPGWGPTSSTNQVWKSADGITWVQEPNAPWIGRHNFGCGTRADGKIWVWGGDDQLTPNFPQTDVWTYDSINGWVQVTSDWGPVAGNRWDGAQCLHKDYMYVAGGHKLDTVRSNDGINWVSMGPLPVDAGVTASAMCSYKGALYLVGGYNVSKVYKSIDDGATWSYVGDVSANMVNATIWCSLSVYQGKLFFLGGSGVTANVSQIVTYTTDGATWTELTSFTMRPRHASGFTYFNNSLFIVAGNQATDSNRIYANTFVPMDYKCIYSLRQFNLAYSGNCLMVRRDSDNATQLIGFSAGVVDTAAIAAFCGGSNGFVQEWYDQSGNANHLLSFVLYIYQPKIYDAATGIILLNSKPAINFAAGQRLYLTSGTPLNLSSNYSLGFVAQLNNSNQEVIIGRNGNEYGFLNYYGQYTHNNGQSPEQFVRFSTAVPPPIYGSLGFYEVYRERMIATFYKNSVAYPAIFTGVNAGFPTYWDSDFYFYQIGAEYPGYETNGLFQELIIREGVTEPNDITSLQTNIYNYYGV